MNKNTFCYLHLFHYNHLFSRVILIRKSRHATGNMYMRVCVYMYVFHNLICLLKSNYYLKCVTIMINLFVSGSGLGIFHDEEQCPL